MCPYPAFFPLPGEVQAMDLERARCLAAIAAEPELPGEMPDAMWALLSRDRAAMTEALRAAVRQAKAGILARVQAPFDDVSTAPTNPRTPFLP